MLNYDSIRKYASEAGFTLCGVARARVLVEYGERLDAGLAASGGAVLRYLADRPERRLDPSTLLPGARTVVVCAVDYRNRYSGGYPTGFTAPKICSYALGGEYQPRIKAMLAWMLSRLREDFAAAEDPGSCDSAPGEVQAAGEVQVPGEVRAPGKVRVPNGKAVAPGGEVQGSKNVPESGETRTLGGKALCDTSAILEKAWAVEAGLGFTGRNSLLVNPAHGSFMLLGELLLDAECDRYDEPFAGPGCGGCRRCVEACPAGAIRRNAVDTGRCISALTIEKTREAVDPGGLHGWIFGCDECQSVCPYNKLSSGGGTGSGGGLFAPMFDPADFPAHRWLEMTPEEFGHLFAATPLRRTGLEKIKKNISR